MIARTTVSAGIVAFALVVVSPIVAADGEDPDGGGQDGGCLDGADIGFVEGNWKTHDPIAYHPLESGGFEVRVYVLAGPDNLVEFWAIVDCSGDSVSKFVDCALASAANPPGILDCIG